MKNKHMMPLACFLVIMALLSSSCIPWLPWPLEPPEEIGAESLKPTRFRALDVDHDLRVLTGDLKVGDGTPTVTQNGEDAYVEGTFEVDGAVRFDSTVTLASTVTVSAGGFHAPNGSLAWPSFAFSNDKDSGLYRVGAGNIGMAADATLVSDWTSTQMDMNSLPIVNIGAAGTDFDSSGGLTLAVTETITAGGVHAPDGSLAWPSLSFSGDKDSGLYRIGAGNIGMVADATLLSDWTSSNMDMNSLPILNIGAAGTDFDTSGGLTLASTATLTGLDINGTLVVIDADADTRLVSSTDDTLTVTLGAATGKLFVNTGNLMVGNGAPTVALDGEDAYVEGTFEVDGAARFDSTLTVATTETISAGGVQAPNGSLSWPSLSFSSEPDSGLYYVGVGNLGLAVDATLVSDWTSTQMDMNSLPIVNIGAAGTDFDSSGGLTLASTMTVSSGGVDLGGTRLTIDSDADTYFAATSDDIITVTIGASTGMLAVGVGNLKVGSGSPTQSLDGEDAYIEGTLEVDGSAYMDGLLTVASTSTLTGLDINGTLTVLDADADTRLTTSTDDTVTVTLGASTGKLFVATGNLMVGNGAPGQTIDGEDAYVEGLLEVDGNAYLDGALDVSGGTITLQNDAIISNTVSGVVAVNGEFGYLHFVLDKAASYTVQDGESGAMFTNDGASTNITFTLPAASEGLVFTFISQDNQVIGIDPNGSDQIFSETNGAGDAIQSTAQYDCITLVATGAGEWLPINVIGTWNDVD